MYDPPPAAVLAPARQDGLTPYAIAFWDEQKGLLTGQAGCPVACGDYIIALTADGGHRWQEVYRGPERITRLAAVAGATGPGAAWASTGTGLLSSTDGGRTWQPAGVGYAEPTFASASAGWALVATGENRWSEESPIYTTRDGGLTWSHFTSPCMGSLAGTAAISLVSETDGWVACVSQPGTGQQAKVLYRTTDGGRTWQEAGEMTWSGYLNGLFFRPGGKGWAWHARGGLQVTANGGRTWEETSRPVSTDDGQTWQWSGAVIPETREARDLWMFSDQVGYLLLREGESRQYQLAKTVDGGASVTVVRQWPIDPPRQGAADSRAGDNHR